MTTKAGVARPAAGRAVCASPPAESGHWGNFRRCGRALNRRPSSSSSCRTRSRSPGTTSEVWARRHRARGLRASWLRVRNPGTLLWESTYDPYLRESVSVGRAECSMSSERSGVWSRDSWPTSSSSQPAASTRCVDLQLTVGPQGSSGQGLAPPTSQLIRVALWLRLIGTRARKRSTSEPLAALAVSEVTALGAA